MTVLAKFAVAFVAAMLALGQPALAAQLSVGPITLDLKAPSSAGTLTLVNNEAHEVTVQTRVFRWVQRDGKETLEPTTDVVASPPSITLAPNANYTVRIVRTSKAPVEGEESYRVIVDQLPDFRREQTNGVNLLIRQSIPVFFHAAESSRSDVTWSLRNDGLDTVLIAENEGDARLRIADLQLQDSTGATISLGPGLLGYVLGRSSMSWTVPYLPRGFGKPGGLRVSAETQEGRIDETIEVLDQ